MNAHEVTLLKISEDGHLIVPFFQRPYVWDEENWDDLAETLLEASIEELSPFLGSIILKDTGEKSWGKSNYHIIDGQQRLTTLTVFLRAFYDEYYEFFSNHPRMNTKINEIVFLYHYQSDDERDARIIHSHIDSCYFNEVIDGKYRDAKALHSITAESPRILRAYAFFRRFLAEKGAEDNTHIPRLCEALLSDSQWSMLVRIEIGQVENEQAIFDTVNTAGVRLTSADSIKNSLFEKLLLKMGAEATSVEKGYRFYEETWQKTFLDNEETTEYWSRLRTTGRLQRETLEILLHGIAVIFGFYGTEKTDRLEDLPKLYKNYIEKLSLSQLKGFIKDICKYAEIYRDNFEVFEENHEFSFDDISERTRKNLELCNISTFDPYLLMLYKKLEEGSITNESFLNELELLDRYIVRTSICHATTKGFNREVVELLHGNTTLSELLEQRKQNEQISDEVVTEALKNIYNKHAKLVLFWIELSREHENKAYTDTTKRPYTFSLEHVMPQKWESHWGIKALPVLDSRKKIVKDEVEATRIRNKAVYQIGNMTLLNHGLNNSLSNEPFLVKRDGSKSSKGKSRPGMKEYSSLLISKEIINEDTWDESRIIARTKRLTKEFFGIW